MKKGDIVRAIDQYAIEEQDWWEAVSDRDLSGMLAPIVKSTVGTVREQEDSDGLFAVDFNVMLPLKLKLYFRENEMEKMK